MSIALLNMSFDINRVNNGRSSASNIYYTVTELRNFAKSFHLYPKGNKSQLVNRILADYRSKLQHIGSPISQIPIAQPIVLPRSQIPREQPIVFPISQIPRVQPIVSPRLTSQPFVSQPFVSPRSPPFVSPLTLQPIVSPRLTSQPFVSQPFVSPRSPLTLQPIGSPLTLQPIQNSQPPIYSSPPIQNSQPPLQLNKTPIRLQAFITDNFRNSVNDLIKDDINFDLTIDQLKTNNNVLLTYLLELERSTPGELRIENEENNILLGYSKMQKANFVLAVKLGKIDIITRMIADNLVDINFQDNIGITAIIFAAKNNNFEMVKFLLKNDANINFQDNFGINALMYAVKNNNFEMVKLLAYSDNHDSEDDSEVYIEIEDNLGNTALMYAVKNNNLDIVDFLVVEMGAEINLKNKYGQTVLQLAANSNTNMIKMLLGIAQRLEVRDMDSNNIIEVLYLKLLNSGIDLNFKDKYGETPLYRAVDNNNSNIVKFLIENGANVDLKSQNDRTPLIRAVEKNNYQLVRYLIRKGANVDLQNQYGITALNLAVRYNLFRIVRLLIRKGANINLEDNTDKLTPIQLAVKLGKLKMVQLLINKGANFDPNNKEYLNLLNRPKYPTTLWN